MQSLSACILGSAKPVFLAARAVHAPGAALLSCAAKIKHQSASCAPAAGGGIRLLGGNQGDGREWIKDCNVH